MAKQLKLSGSLGGLSTPREHWDILVSQTISEDPPLPPKLFTEGRENACNALNAIFEGKIQKLFLFAESPNDVADFIAAYIETLDTESAKVYSNRCLIVKEEDAWRGVVEAHRSHILVADPRLGLETEEHADLQTIATRKGHSIVIPLCGAWAGGNPEIIKLRSPSQNQIQRVLEDAGFSNIRSRELARIGGDRISALRRHLHGLGMLPPYGTWENARLIAQAGLAGKWDGNSPADRSALEKLLGKEYGEWIETLRHEALRLDTPLIQQDERWRFVARGEAWNTLGSRISDDDLDLFQKVAIIVLGERDPQFDLPKEKRFSAGIYEKQLKHSSIFREGIAETLALIGSHSNSLTSCSLGKAETTALLVVRELLSNADWERFASLNSLLPLLAEAAPDEFLDNLEASLEDIDNSPFHQIFAQEGSGGVGGWNYMSGLLWALETLAWHPDFLSRVAVILADIASFDPGGNWSNRPSNSLVDIFLPWHVQTTASFTKRIAAVKIILREQPEVGWKFLLDLLPHSHGITSGCHKPTWRNYIPRDWKEGVLKSEYWEQITIYTELAVKLAITSIERFEELIQHIPDLPEPAQEKLLEHLNSNDFLKLSEEKRFIVWEKLESLIRKHKRYAQADWAMPDEVIKKIEVTLKKIEPKSIELKNYNLFSGKDYDLYDENGNYDEQRKNLDKKRQEVIQLIISKGGLEAVLSFSNNVIAPYEVGRALGSIEYQVAEQKILPSLLNSKREIEEKFVTGFVWGRYNKLGWNWVDSILKDLQSPNDKSSLLIILPFEKEVWSRVEGNLADDNEGLYWQEVVVNPYGKDRDLSFAIKKLIKHNRPAAAVNCASRMIENKDLFREDLAIKSLLSVLEAPNPDTMDRLDQYQTIELIKHLQKKSIKYEDQLFKIEWNFLPWLDRFSTGSPVTLENRLISDPNFFAEIVALVFRSKNEDRKKTEPSEQQKHLAQNAYKLLTEWKTCPGQTSEGNFDDKKFLRWIEEAERITKETGHIEVAQIQIGYVLTHAPKDPSGLWIHKTVASVINRRGAKEIRSGFTTQLFNARGVYGFSAGKEEKKIAELNRVKAEALEENGYHRFATAMREFAESYERMAERESKRDPFDR